MVILNVVFQRYQNRPAARFWVTTHRFQFPSLWHLVAGSAEMCVLAVVNICLTLTVRITTRTTFHSARTGRFNAVIKKLSVFQVLPSVYIC